MTTLAAPSAAPAEEFTEHPHIVRVENVPMLRGTRLSVRLIAQMYRAGDTVDDILQSYPHASATAVYDAISYYLDHRDQIEQEIIAHRIENVLARHGAQMSERGFITFSASPAHG
jgi:uncharacterized protein (DUF433 family)